MRNSTTTNIRIARVTGTVGRVRSVTRDSTSATNFYTNKQIIRPRLSRSSYFKKLIQLAVTTAARISLRIIPSLTKKRRMTAAFSDLKTSFHTVN